MAELLKHRYNDAFFDKVNTAIQVVQKDFNRKSFLKQLYGDGWDEKELKQRMRAITLILNDHLPGGYKSKIKSILKLIPELIRVGLKEDNFECMFIPDFVEVYGMDDYKISIHALERITQYVSCEFAVRPFILRYPEEMIGQMTN